MPKFKLVFKSDYDGDWYQIWRDDSCLKCFGVYDDPPEEVKIKAENFFNDVVNKQKKPTIEIIKTVEL